MADSKHANNKEKQVPHPILETTRLVNKIKKKCLSDEYTEFLTKEDWMKRIFDAEWNARMILEKTKRNLVLQCKIAEHPQIHKSLRDARIMKLGSHYRLAKICNGKQYACYHVIKTTRKCHYMEGIECPFEAEEIEKGLWYTYNKRSKFVLELHAGLDEAEKVQDILRSIPIGHLTEETATSRDGEMFTYSTANIDIIYQRRDEYLPITGFVTYQLVAVRFKYTAGIDEYRGRQGEEYEEAQQAIEHAKRKFKEVAGYEFEDDEVVKQRRIRESRPARCLQKFGKV